MRNIKYSEFVELNKLHAVVRGRWSAKFNLITYELEDGTQIRITAKEIKGRPVRWCAPDEKQLLKLSFYPVL